MPTNTLQEVEGCKIARPGEGSRYLLQGGIWPWHRFHLLIYHTIIPSRQKGHPSASPRRHWQISLAGCCMPAPSAPNSSSVATATAVSPAVRDAAWLWGPAHAASIFVVSALPAPSNPSSGLGETHLSARSTLWSANHAPAPAAYLSVPSSLVPFPVLALAAPSGTHSLSLYPVSAPTTITPR